VSIKTRRKDNSNHNARTGTMSTKTELIEAVTESIKQGLKLWLLGDDPDDPPPPPQYESNHKPAG
jgi:hypothetical protein